MAGDIRHTHPQTADFAQRRLHGRHQLGLHLVLDLAAAVGIRHVPAHVLIEQQRIRNPEGIGTVAADSHVHIQADIVIYVAERYGRSRAVQIVHDLFGIEKIHPLILGGSAPKAEALPKGLEGLFQVLSQVSVEQAGLRGIVVDKLPGLRAEFRNAALLYDHHALSLVDSDDGAVRDDIIHSLVAVTAAARALPPFCHQNVI